MQRICLIKIFILQQIKKLNEVILFLYVRKHLMKKMSSFYKMMKKLGGKNIFSYEHGSDKVKYIIECK